MTSPQPYALPPKPGKYHIVNVQTGTVIEVPHYNQERSVSGIWKDKPNQHWFVQRSGCGYKIKNCQYGVYLAASSSKEGTVVGASDKATVWNLARTHGGFAIQYENEDRAINLHFAHAGDNNILLLWGFGELKDHRRWKFQRISDDVGGEKADPIEDENHQLRRELTEKTAQLALQEEELAKKCQEIVEKDRIIAAQAASLHQIGAPQCTTSKMVEINARLDQLDQIVRQTRTIMDGLRLESNNIGHHTDKEMD